MIRTASLAFLFCIGACTSTSSSNVDLSGVDLAGLDLNGVDLARDLTSSSTDLSGDMTASNVDQAGDPVVLVAPNGSLTISPNDVTIKAGQSVIWKWTAANNDRTAHPILSDGNTKEPEIDSSNAESKTQYTHTFTTAKDYPYHCVAHETEMKGTIHVTEK